jgi:hypothetical protein
MTPMTILVDEAPRCVVRPTDAKALNRFLRNARPYLLRAAPEGKLSFRAADAQEAARWRDAFELHRAAGCDEEEFFGVPL